LVAAWNPAARSSFCSAFDSIDNKQQPHGPRPKPLKDTMHTQSHAKPVKTLAKPSPKKPSHKALASWQPLPSGLTSEEIRAIIIDQIG
jgi:hypothetical protein